MLVRFFGRRVRRDVVFGCCQGGGGCCEAVRLGGRSPDCADDSPVVVWKVQKPELHPELADAFGLPFAVVYGVRTDTLVEHGRCLVVSAVARQIPKSRLPAVDRAGVRLARRVLAHVPFDGKIIVVVLHLGPVDHPGEAWNFLECAVSRE